MKLINANLCCQCDELFEGETCPSCTSTSLIQVARIIAPLADDCEQKLQRVVRKAFKDYETATQ